MVLTEAAIGCDNRWDRGVTRMSTPGELVKVTATVLGLPAAYVASTYRVLRQAGLVTKGGRGPSAAKMTARDAAILLGGILGTGQIIKAANAVDQFLKRIPHNPPTPFKRLKIAGLSDLPTDHSFIDALAAIISVAAEGRLILGTPRDESPEWEKVTVTVENPPTVASITIKIDPTREAFVFAHYGLPEKYHPIRDWKLCWAQKHRQSAILKESRRVNTRIFLYLGAFLTGKPEPRLPGLETFEVAN
jgi:hypothetical protein